MRNLASILAILCCAAVARADDTPPLPLGAPDVSGARALGLAAARSVAGGNEGIFLNAASLAARPRYAIETQWALDRAADENRAQIWGASVVDSRTAKVTGGFAYTNLSKAASTGSMYHLALASRVGGNLYAGVTGKYLRLGGVDAANAATMDASLYLARSMFALGVSGYNLVDTGHRFNAPRGVGGGVAAGNGRTFNLAADWRTDFERSSDEAGEKEKTHSWSVGAEYLAMQNFPIRGGFLRDETRGGKWWTAGVGLVSTAGFAVDAAYQQSIDDSSARIFGAALKLFILN